MPGTPLYVQAASGDTPVQIPARDYRRLIDAAYPYERTIGTGSFRVHQRTAGANMTVEIDPGQAIVQGDDATDQGRYLCTSLAVSSLTFTAPASGTRTHRVVLQVRDRLYNAAYGDYQWDVISVLDTGSGLPALPPSCLPLARVTVAAGATSLADAVIVPETASYGTPAVTAYVSAAQTYALGGQQVANLTLATATGGFTLVSNQRVTIPRTGLYRVSAQARCSQGSGSSQWLVRVMLGGTTATDGQAVAQAFAVVGVNHTPSTATMLYQFNAGDYVRLVVEAGAAGTLQAGAVNSFLTLELVA